MVYPTGKVTSTSVVVPVNILLLPAEKTVVTLALLINSRIQQMPLLVPKTAGPLVVTGT